MASFYMIPEETKDPAQGEAEVEENQGVEAQPTQEIDQMQEENN
jgi:hypothetical protein